MFNTIDFHNRLAEKIGKFSDNDKNSAAINNLTKIADILCSTLNCSSNETIVDDLTVIFLEAAYSSPLYNDKKETDLRTIINGKHAEAYTSHLIDLLSDPNYSQFIASQYATNKDRHFFFKSITALLDLSIKKIKLPNDYLADYCSITQLFQDDKRIFKHLDTLEKELQYFAKNAKKILVAAQNENSLFALPAASSDKPYSRQKILSEFLYNWALSEGFNQEKYAKVNSSLGDDEFLGLLKNKIVFKDAGTDFMHGYWPHLLQFYLISAECKSNKNFLQHSLLDIYTSMTQIKSSTKSVNMNWTFKDNAAQEHLLWDILFDKEITYCKDYRCPENLTGRLIKDADTEKRWPLVSESVKRASDKSKKRSMLSKADIEYRSYKKNTKT